MAFCAKRETRGGEQTIGYAAPTRLRSLEACAKTGVSLRRYKCASFTPALHTKTQLPLFSTSIFIYTYFKSSDWRIAAAQAWRCC